MADERKPNFLSRAVQAVKGGSELEKPAAEVFDPFDVYRDPDYVPQVDGVKVETLTADQVDRRAGADLTDAQREGIRAQAALLAQTRGVSTPSPAASGASADDFARGMALEHAQSELRKVKARLAQMGLS